MKFRNGVFRSITLILSTSFWFALVTVLLIGCSRSEPPVARDRIRIGFFPNVTHGQALVAKNTGAYDSVNGGKIDWIKFNAGPSAIESIFAGELDAVYIGPSPSINGYVKSRGEKFQVVAGAAIGGAGLVIQSDLSIEPIKDSAGRVNAAPGAFEGKIIATPQLGNTQDIAARSWFKAQGYIPKEKGGTLSIMPIENPEQLALMKRKEIQGAWTVEPWLSRLEIEAGARLFLDEKDLWPDGRFVTTHLVFAKEFLKKSPAIAEKLIAAHVAVTQKINGDLAKAGSIILEQIFAETGNRLSSQAIESSMRRIQFTWDPASPSLYHSARAAFELGLLREQPVLDGIYDLKLLNSTLRGLNLPVIEG